MLSIFSFMTKSGTIRLYNCDCVVGCIHGYFLTGFIFVNFASQTSQKCSLQVMSSLHV